MPKAGVFSKASNHIANRSEQIWYCCNRRCHIHIVLAPKTKQTKKQTKQKNHCLKFTGFFFGFFKACKKVKTWNQKKTKNPLQNGGWILCGSKLPIMTFPEKPAPPRGPRTLVWVPQHWSNASARLHDRSSQRPPQGVENLTTWDGAITP